MIEIMLTTILFAYIKIKIKITWCQGLKLRLVPMFLARNHNITET